MSEKQLSRFKLLWQQWHNTHESACVALSSAVNIHGRLQELTTRTAWEGLFTECEQASVHTRQELSPDDTPGLSDLVVMKQLASMDRALSVMRGHHEQLQQHVRDLEHLYVEVSRGMGSGSTLSSMALSQGPQPSLAQVVEALQDAWCMCRDELLLKTAVLGLIRLDASPAHMATLLQCYQDQPNVRREGVDAVLSFWQETRPQDTR